MDLFVDLILYRRAFETQAIENGGSSVIVKYRYTRVFFTSVKEFDIKKISIPAPRYISVILFDRTAANKILKIEKTILDNDNLKFSVRDIK